MCFFAILAVWIYLSLKLYVITTQTANLEHWAEACWQKSSCEKCLKPCWKGREGGWSCWHPCSSVPCSCPTLLATWASFHGGGGSGLCVPGWLLQQPWDGMEGEEVWLRLTPCHCFVYESHHFGGVWQADGLGASWNISFCQEMNPVHVEEGSLMCHCNACMLTACCFATLHPSSAVMQCHRWEKGLGAWTGSTDS